MPRMKLLPRLLLLLWCLSSLVPPAGAADPVKSTTYYNLHYGSWLEVAEALTPYLDAAFTSPRDVLGYANNGYGKIDVYFYSEPTSTTTGYTIRGENAIYINLRQGSSLNRSYLTDYGSTVAHETAHVFFFHQTNLQDRYEVGSVGASCYTWLTESLSYYVGDVVYPYGSQYSKAQLGSLLSVYSLNGAYRSTWYDTGRRYKYGYPSALDMVQLESIGQFLADLGGWRAIQGALSYLAQDGNFDSAYQKAFGLASGQFSVASGATTNTLYSEYLHYYLGHY